MNSPRLRETTFKVQNGKVEVVTATIPNTVDAVSLGEKRPPVLGFGSEPKKFPRKGFV